MYGDDNQVHSKFSVSFKGAGQQVEHKEGIQHNADNWDIGRQFEHIVQKWINYIQSSDSL